MSEPPDRVREPEPEFGAGSVTLGDVGESALLERLVAIAAATGPAALAALGGDDAAVWSPPPGQDLAVSIDALVEDVDFRRSWLTPRGLGRRAFAIAASDLAGTGAAAAHCVATLCARPTEHLDDILEIQRGLCEAAAAAGCAVVGGDVSATAGPLVIDVCVTGTVATGSSLRRAEARPGDALLVTGVLGRAAAGLRLLLDGVPAATDAEHRWVEAQLQPAARLREGRELVTRGVRCGGDISDGLLIDAARTARAAGCAVELWADAVPVDGELCARFGDEWQELALGGGEDFELLVAMPEAGVAALIDAWPDGLAPLTRVGTLHEGEGLRLLSGRGGDEVAEPPSRARHFS